MNIDVPGVQAEKLHVPPLYAVVSCTMSHPQKTPVFDRETVPETYMTI